ncbi:hypothetical protein G7067_01935 [Leucobacter insecticola]|uniref:AbiEi antitoxin N-terminal domain-containing protein n=1 Tax=Leucobacter insecticola TaxID=2714934 RepID=A0A6G8FGF3_9MICO|nr:type IV toxin-antitoxin system AbiEi family antitoxin domain-containing protein [Leucobacter insecticola]QIM15448.1 hypothetical protein G7067_01935 [Leucobacter insecticola]
MKRSVALRLLAEVAASQWGLVTAAQAGARGVSHLMLARLADAGDLVRLAHGVYRDAGAPTSEHEELRSAWLSIEPARFAWERIQDRPEGATVSGESAARLLGIGDFRAIRHEFTVPRRRQTQRPDVRFRTRALADPDVTVREGLPVTSIERTIADLVESRAQLEHVARALRDAMRRESVDVDRLTALLAPLAARNGHRKEDGRDLLQQLLATVGLDQQSLIKQLTRATRRLLPMEVVSPTEAQELKRRAAAQSESADIADLVRFVERLSQLAPANTSERST